ncbi:putative interactor of constitutive active ROPs [Helianthus debilis subsp. tardiflorus]
MPRARSEMAPRVSTRGPAPLRTSSSDSDPLNHRSPKLGDRRSPRSAGSDPLNQKKLGTRIAGLETQLEQAQGELKILKDQLASAEAAKKEAQKELEKRSRTNKPPVSEPGLGPDPVQDTRSSPSENQDLNNEISEETDVFEVPIEMVSVEKGDQGEVKVKVKVDDSPESPEKTRVEEEFSVKNEEISVLKMKMEEKDKRLEAFSQENENLKSQLAEATVKDEKLNLRLSQIEQEFKKSQNDGIQLKEKLKEVEGAKEALETEMKRLRVQTEQWRKAADAAAAILSGGADMNDGRRVSERCGSMEKHYGGVFDGYVGSPGLGDELDDGLKRKGSGIRMFGDLWKKKGQK